MGGGFVCSIKLKITLYYHQITLYLEELRLTDGQILVILL